MRDDLLDQREHADIALADEMQLHPLGLPPCRRVGERDSCRRAGAARREPSETASTPSEIVSQRPAQTAVSSDELPDSDVGGAGCIDQVSPMLGSLDEADGVAPVIPITFPVRLIQRRAAADPALLVPSGVVMLDPRVLTVDVGVSRFRDPDELVIRESVPVGIEHRVAEINAPAPLFDITSSDQRMGGVVRQGRDRIDRTHDADSRIRHRSDGRFVNDNFVAIN